MKIMERNKKKLAYKLYLGKEDMVNEKGFKTGEKIPKYSEKKFEKASIESPSDFAYLEKYGVSIDYERILKFDKMDLPFDENTIFFIDDVNAEFHDYEVKWIRPTLNVLSVMVQKVNTKQGN